MNLRNLSTAFLASASVFSLMTGPVLAATSGLFTYTDTGTSITITDYPESAVGSVEIPASIAGKPVTIIGGSAFHSCSSLTGITIPAGVTTIRWAAFYNCTSLTSVAIPNSVTSIEPWTFYNCTSLSDVTIPNKITSIGSYTFYNCGSLPAVTIPTGVTSIGDHAFFGCTSLTGIDIPNSVTTIMEQAFVNCSGIGHVTIGNKVTAIGYAGFLGCSSLPEITIPDSVTYLGDGVFMSCNSLTHIAIGKNVNHIGVQAFDHCSSLASITIPYGVTSIEAQTFSECSSLINVKLPTSVTSIGTNAFRGCANLPGITIPNSVTSIGDRAFEYCGSLTSVTIPNSVTSIGESAFGVCTKLPGITIPSGVKSIIANTFALCTNLTRVTIPSSVTAIRSYAFYGCTGLTNAVFLGNAPSMGEMVFYEPANSFTIYYPEGSTGFASPTWLGYPTQVCLPEIVIEQPSGTDIADGGTRSFGTVVVGSASSFTFTLKNTGTPGLAGLVITKNGTNASDFTITVNPVSPVIPGEDTTFTVRFTPSGCGTRTAAIHIASNDANENPFDITLTGKGTGPEIAIQQPVGKTIADGRAKSFGKVMVGKKAKLTFTIKNTGNAKLTGLKLTKNGANAAKFALSALPVSTLAPGASTTFTVTFKPSTPGSQSAVIHLANNDANENPYDITLTGRGTGDAKPAPELAKASISTMENKTATRGNSSPRWIRSTVPNTWHW